MSGRHIGWIVLATLSATGCASTPQDAFGNTPTYQVFDLGPRTSLLKTWTYNPLAGTPFERHWERQYGRSSDLLPDHFHSDLTWLLTAYYGGVLPVATGRAFDIDRAGRVVGSAAAVMGPPGGPPQVQNVPAILSDGNTYGMADLPTGAAHGINDHLQVVGATTSGLLSQAFRWDGLTDTFEMLDDEGAFLSSAEAINDAGVIVGYAFIAGSNQPFRIQDGVFSVLSTPAGAGEALDINGSGVVAGRVTVNGSTTAARWSTTGQSQPLSGTTDVLGHPVPSSGNAINDVFTVAGYLWVDGVQRPVTWSLTGALIELGPDDLVSGEALDINKSGIVVGKANRGEGNFAFVTSEFRNLEKHVDQSLGWTFHEAVAINDQGWITGHGRLAGDERIFLLVPWGQSWPVYTTGQQVLTVDPVP